MIIIFMFVAFGTHVSATNSLEALMALPITERAVRIIKFYETLHIGKGNVIGYGHTIQKGEPFQPNQVLTEREADRLLRQDLAKLCKMFGEYKNHAVLLAVLSYNIGPTKVLNSNLLKKIESGETDIASDYLSFCNYHGKPHPRIRHRRWVEYLLLKNS